MPLKKSDLVILCLLYNHKIVYSTENLFNYTLFHKKSKAVLINKYNKFFY